MRKAVVTALSLLALTGCGTTPNLAGVVTPSRVHTASTGKAFTQLIFGLQEDFFSTVRDRVKERMAQAPTGPNGELETVTDFQSRDMAARPTAGGGTELVGKADIVGTWPQNSYVPHQITRSFRLSLDARGKLLSLDLDANLAGEQIDRPAYKAINKAAGEQLKAELTAFIKAPGQEALRSLPMWKAIAKLDTRTTAEFKQFEATPGNFGTFGKLFRFKVTLRFNNVVVLEDMPVQVITNPAGRITNAF